MEDDGGGEDGDEGDDNGGSDEGVETKKQKKMPEIGWEKLGGKRDIRKAIKPYLTQALQEAMGVSKIDTKLITAIVHGVHAQSPPKITDALTPHLGDHTSAFVLSFLDHLRTLTTTSEQ